MVAVAHGAAAAKYALLQIPLEDGNRRLGGTDQVAADRQRSRRDPVFSPLLDNKTGYTTHNALCAPMQARGNVLGVLLVSNTEDGRDFAVEDMEWLSALAAQASIAIENARLYSSLRDERDRIIQAEEELRRRLAGNLHDKAAQLVGSLLMNLEVARHVAATRPEQIGAELNILRDLVQQVNVAIRQSLLELRPVMLESRGLAGAARLCQSTTAVGLCSHRRDQRPAAHSQPSSRNRHLPRRPGGAFQRAPPCTRRVHLAAGLDRGKLADSGGGG